MKDSLRFFIVILFSAALFSCSDFSSPTVPETESNFQMEPLKLPTSNKSISTETIFSTSGVIQGGAGGTINFYFDYIASSGQTVDVNGILTIPAGAFSGDKTIDIIVDNEEAIIDFYPSPITFNIPLLLNLEYSGLNLDENADNFGFYYIDPNNNYESITSSAIEINITQGKIGVVDAVIPHFSRFGFFR